MKNQNKTKDHKQSSRAKLLQAGIALFAEKGYAGTSVREIVVQAGVTKPVLYYYFKNKEGMFRAILDGAAKQQETILAEVLETPGTALDRLISLYRHIYEGVRENQDLFKMIHNLIFGPPQAVPAYDFRHYERRMVDAIKSVYAQGIGLDEVSQADPEDVAILLLSLLDFCLHMDHIYPESSDPGRPERLLRLAFRGIARRDKK